MSSRTRTSTPLIAALLIALPVSAGAQETEPSRFESATIAVPPSAVAASPDPLRPCSDARPCVARATAGALLGSAAGALAGAALLGGGAALAYRGTYDDGGPALAAAIGAIGGAAVGIPVGAHIGNRSRGNIAAVIVSPIVAMAGAAYLVSTTEGGTGGWTIPLVGLASAVGVEVLTARVGTR